ncbi:MAG TPA: hypothetical protein VJL89_01295, partial [Thermodesulfovibrionia bacterium]|nr:hypothetical protein [Thermodesulfovibrionia bacterium]
ESRHTVDRQTMELAFDEAVVSGHTVLYQLIVGESKTEAEKNYLYGFCNQTWQLPPEDPSTRQRLNHRQLIVEENGKWRLRAPLMARWMRKRI